MSYTLASEPVAFHSRSEPFAYPVSRNGLCDFGPGEILACVALLLTRKERNNGVGRHLLHNMRRKGSHLQMYWDAETESTFGFFLKKAPGEQTRFSLYLFGETAWKLLARLNGKILQEYAVMETERRRNERRKLKKAGLWRELPRIKSLRALPGASRRLKRHFRNSALTWSAAMEAIGYALRKDRSWVHERLTRSLDERGVASFRTDGGFVFRVDLAHPSRLPDALGAVELLTTNDNSHGAYRRLRNFLRRHFKCGRRHRENRICMRAWRKRQQTLRILAAAGMAA